GTVFFVPVVATLLASGRAASPLEITAMLVVYYAASSLLGLYVGHWADRSGRPLELMALGLAILGLGMGGFYVALVLVSGAAGFAAAIIAALVVGFGSSFYHPLGASLLQAGFDRRQLGTALGINGAIGSVGRALYPTLFFLIGLLITDNSAVLAFAAIGLAASAVVASSGPGRRPANPPAAGTRGAPTARQAFTLGIVTLAAVAFVRSAATFGVVAFLPTYLQLVRPLWPGAPLGVEVTILYLGGILGQPFFGALASRIDIRLLLSVTSLGSALSTLGFLLVGGAPAVAFLAGLPPRGRRARRRLPVPHRLLHVQRVPAADVPLGRVRGSPLHEPRELVGLRPRQRRRDGDRPIDRRAHHRERVRPPPARLCRDDRARRRGRRGGPGDPAVRHAAFPDAPVRLALPRWAPLPIRSGHPARAAALPGTTSPGSGISYDRRDLGACSGSSIIGNTIRRRE
ncbi:MAG: MFS transporter, partial [Thermoplasmatales archaeon]|nr:MFS transporter [Thermoplasmatales archaeon]